MNKLIISLICILISSNPITYAMESGSNDWSNSLKKAQTYFNSAIDTILGESVSTDVENFTRNTLREIGISENKINDIRIRKGKGFYATDSRLIVPLATISRNPEQPITDAFDNPSINLSKACIAHEAGHIEHNHFIKSILSVLFISQFWVSIHTKTDQKIKQSLLNSGSKIALRGINVCLLYQLGSCCISLNNKFQEYQADTFAINHITDPSVLKAMVAPMNNHHKKTHNKLSPGLKNLCEKFPLAEEVLNPAYKKHPSSLSRAQRYEKAAQELEKKISKP